MLTVKEMVITFDLSGLGVIPVVHPDHPQKVYPNAGHNIQPTTGIVTMHVNGSGHERTVSSTVSIHGFVVRQDGDRNRQFNTLVPAYGHTDLQEQLRELALQSIDWEGRARASLGG